MLMKSRVLMLCIFVLLLFGIVMCASPSGNQEIGASCDDFRKVSQAPSVLNEKIEIKSGMLLTVKLCSNRTTGFQWTEKAKISDPSILQQIEHKYIAPGAKILGAPGEEVWVFKAIKEGNGVVSMEYSRPWESGEKGIWEYRVSVLVK